MSIRIRYLARSVEGIIRPVLAHLENDDALDNLESSVDIDIVEKNGLFNVHCDEDGRGEFVTGPEVMPLIHQLILKKVFKTSGCLAAFHAGAVCDDTASLLLPAASGSGKSTLVAALVSSGWTYQTDELVLLMPDTSLCPLPISLGLKRGSWPLFKTSIPGLASIPIHHQPDGTEIKYIVPPQLTPLMIHPPLRALVFPKYIDGADTKLTPMSSAKGLYHLAQSGYAVAGDLTPELVATLINWVSKHGCYDLQVGSLDTAVSTVRKLLE